MKKLAIIGLLMLTGCSGVSNTGNTNNGSGGSTGGSPTSPNVSGSWSGNLTGTNFTGTITLDTNLTQDSSGDVTGSILAPTGDCPISAQLSGTMSGSSLTLSDSAGTFVTIQATLASNGQSLAGNISFAAGPCGTQSNPWTGSFSQTK